MILNGLFGTKFNFRPPKKTFKHLKQFHSNSGHKVPWFKPGKVF